MSRFIAAICLTVTICVSVAAHAQNPSTEWVGYGGPGGSRVFPNEDPPTKFDQTKGEGVKWETPLPVWSNSSPLYVSGKVFVTCEVGPENVFPLLVCLDAQTGKILWKRPIDHLPAITADADKQAALRKQLGAYFDREAELIAAYAKKSGRARRDHAPKKDKAQSQLEKSLYQQMGLMRDNFRRGGYCTSYPCMGEAYGTPVTDGRHVYVATLWGGFACYDFEGELKWVAYERSTRHTWCNPGRSPILWNKQLIYNGGGTMRAFDKTTGKLLWKHEDPKGAYGIVTPAVVTIGQQDVLLAAGPSAYLLPEGKPLKVTGWVSEGMQILVHPEQRDVAYFCGSGEHCGWKNKGRTEIQPPAAFRFSLEGDTLTGKVIWHGGDLGTTKAWGGNAPWMVVHKGKFYHREGAILDAMTGKVLAGKFGGRWPSQRAAPRTNHMLLIAGGHVYGLDNAKSTEAGPGAALIVYTLDGKHVASNPLVRKAPTPSQQAMHEYLTGQKQPWMTGRKARFAYGWAFTFGGDRIYIRTLESLICIGK